MRAREFVNESRLLIDVPNEEWLADKVDWAKKKGRNSFGVPYLGSVTARPSDRNLRLPVSLLKQLPGMRAEQQNVRREDLKTLMKIMQDTGKLPLMDNGEEYRPFINVAWNGEAWVNEGNHRIMAATALGWKDLPVELAYFDGGERIESGPLYPKKIGLQQGVNETKILDEGRSQPTIVVDVQPEYCGDNDICQQIINFVQNQTGPVLMFVNAEEMGLTGDTLQSIRAWWEEQAGAEYDDLEDSYTQPIDWSRFQIVDKGYGYLRSWMDHGIEASTIIATIRELYQQKKSDSRELSFPPANQRTVQQSLIMGAIEEMDGDPLIVNWISLAQLKKFSGAYLVGGCRNECLREVEFLMNAFNIRYKRVDSLVYENFNKKYKNQQGVTEGANNITYKHQKGKNKFSVEMSVDGKPAGVFQYDANTGRTIAELNPAYRGQGLGQRLILKGIHTAAMLGMDYLEDESRTAMFDRALDSLADAGYVVNDEEYWYVTDRGEQFLKQGVTENFADGKVKGKSRPGRVKRSGASCKGSVSDLRARAKKYGGERGKMYHWCANMKGGKK